MHVHFEHWASIDILNVVLYFPLVHRIPAENISYFFPTATFVNRGLLGELYSDVVFDGLFLEGERPRKHRTEIMQQLRS